MMSGRLQEKAKWKEVGIEVEPNPEHKYADDPWVFVHYSSIPKLGVNPNSEDIEGMSPVGIYGWPIKSTASEMFKGMRYRFVFRVRPEARKDILAFGPGPSEFDATREELLDAIGDAIGNVSPSFEDNWYWAVDLRKLKTEGEDQKVYDALVYSLRKSRQMGMLLTKVLMKSHVKGVVDWGLAQIYDSEEERAQGVFFRLSDLEILSMDDQNRKADSLIGNIRNQIEGIFSPLREIHLEEGESGWSANVPPYVSYKFNGVSMVVFRKENDKWSVSMRTRVLGLGPSESFHLRDAILKEATRLLEETKRTSRYQEPEQIALERLVSSLS